MRNVVVITTGGTIASTSDASGAKVSSVSGLQLVAGQPLPAGVAVQVVEVTNLNSYEITFAEMDLVQLAVTTALDDPATCGVVVTHGTDTLEETAMLVDLFHTDDRPVVFTGAQVSHDDYGADGPGNLAQAIAVAATPDARRLGVLVCFAGVLHAARGTRKAHNSDAAAFLDVDHGPVGLVMDDGRTRIHTRLRRAATGLDVPVPVAGTRVDIIALYPGADATAVTAHLEQGARGLVLQATGFGNANASIVTAVAACTARAVPVVLSTRVAGGEVSPVYGGGGGGVDLVAAGAVPSGSLRPSQARVLLAALVAAGRDRRHIVRAFAARPQRFRAAGDQIPATLPV